MCRIEIDLGNHNIKLGNGKRFSAAYTLLSSEPTFSNGDKIINYDGKFYSMGKGTFEKNQNKYSKECIIPQILFAIEQTTPTKNVDLALGIPQNQSQQIEKIKPSIENTEFIYKYNGSARTVKINRVDIYPEGTTSFYVLPEDVRKNKRVLLIDIGGFTTNYSIFNKGSRDVENSNSLSFGMNDFYETIQNRENQNGNPINSIEECKEVIEDGYVGNLEDEKKQFLKNLINELSGKKINSKLYEVYFTGGGTEFLKDTIKICIPRANILENPLFTNIEGIKKIAEIKFKNK